VRPEGRQAIVATNNQRFAHRQREAHELMVRRRVRLRFRKEGDLRLIGHLDLVRAWERILRRAGVPLVMTEGCHRRPRISLPSALPMGEAGHDEVVEVDFDGDETIDAIRTTIQASVPAGLTTTQVEELPPTAPSALVSEFAYEFPLPADRQAETAARVASLLAQSTLPVARSAKPTADLRGLLVAAAVDGGVLRFRLSASRERSLRAKDILTALGLDDLREQGLYPVRTEVVLAR
jgi:radical SAM-linked protein